MSYWWNFSHWLYWKLSKWQLPFSIIRKLIATPILFLKGHSGQQWNIIQRPYLEWWIVQAFGILWHHLVFPTSQGRFNVVRVCELPRASDTTLRNTLNIWHKSTKSLMCYQHILKFSQTTCYFIGYTEQFIVVWYHVWNTPISTKACCKKQLHVLEWYPWATSYVKKIGCPFEANTPAT